MYWKGRKTKSYGQKEAREGCHLALALGHLASWQYLLMRATVYSIWVKSQSGPREVSSRSSVWQEDHVEEQRKTQAARELVDCLAHSTLCALKPSK